MLEVAVAILYQFDQFDRQPGRGAPPDRFLMQLRDDVPGILYPGHWGLFGGHLEAGETAEAAIYRELQEEISYVPLGLTKFGCFSDDRAIRHVYQAELTVGLAALVLGEGWDLDWLTPADIQRGDRYSQRAQQIRPLAPMPQRVLLEFLRQIC